MEGFAEVLGEEVGGKGCEALLDAGEGSGGVLQGFDVAHVGYESGLCAGAKGSVGCDEGLAEVFQAYFFTGGEDEALPVGSGEELGEGTTGSGSGFDRYGVGFIQQEDETLAR